MKIAQDFRRIAREALKGKWGIAVIVGLVAVLLGATSSDGPEISLDLGSTGNTLTFNAEGNNLLSIFTGLDEFTKTIIFSTLSVVIVIALIFGIIYFVLGSFTGIGYAKFNLDLVDKKDAGFNSLFSYFSNWKTAAATRFLKALYVFLWSLLLIIPGIVKSYSYAMTDYILAENPNMTAKEAIERSKWMMDDNRWRLFCLQFSFIGWGILAGFTFGIGNLWLTPYKQAATAAFYREVSGTEKDILEDITIFSENE